MYLRAMGRNIIVSEETIRDLLEAHASLSAWYYELSAGLRAANGTARTPDDAARSAFVARLAGDFPELAGVARTITVPRSFVPPPPQAMGAPSPVSPVDGGLDDEFPTAIEPAPARVREAAQPAGPPAAPAVAPPALVNPTSVKYEGER